MSSKPGRKHGSWENDVGWTIRGVATRYYQRPGGRYTNKDILENALYKHFSKQTVWDAVNKGKPITANAIYNRAHHADDFSGTPTEDIDTNPTAIKMQPLFDKIIKKKLYFRNLDELSKAVIAYTRTLELESDEGEEDVDTEYNDKEEEEEKENSVTTAVIRIYNNKSTLEILDATDYADPIPFIEVSAYGIKDISRSEKAKLMEKAEELFDIVSSLAK